MNIDSNGGVKCRCRKCGVSFNMGARQFLRASMLERTTCKSCLKKGGKKQK